MISNRAWAIIIAAGEAQMVKGRMWWKWVFWLFIAGLVIVLFSEF
jgi:hypothetical protein